MSFILMEKSIDDKQRVSSAITYLRLADRHKQKTKVCRLFTFSLRQYYRDYKNDDDGRADQDIVIFLFIDKLA